MNPSEKQILYVNRIIKKLGNEHVYSYISQFWPDINLDSLSKKQAQKIITGLGHRIAKPIYGVVGRDIPFTR